MTKEEFFNEVKGEKIRWSTWGKDSYFIPTRWTGGNEIEGIRCDKNELDRRHIYYINDGFEKLYGKAYWEYYRESKTYLANDGTEAWY